MAALPRSCKLLCSGREEASRLKEAQVRHRFVVTTLVSPTPGETKKWGSLSLCQLRKRWASPPKNVSTGSPRSQGNDDAEWRSRRERLSRVGTATLGYPARRGGPAHTPGLFRFRNKITMPYICILSKPTLPATNRIQSGVNSKEPVFR